VSIKGLYFKPKRKPGRTVVWYVYAYRGGPLIARREGGTKPQLTRDEAQAALDAIEALRKPDPRLLVSLIREWEASPEWKALADSTRRTWRSQLAAIEARWGAKPLSVWNDPRMKAKVVEWRNSRAETPRGADLGVMVLRELLKFGLLSARVLLNAADGVPNLYRGGQRAEIVWTDEDMDRFAWAAIREDRAHLIDGMWLAALTGMRRADLVTVTDANVYDAAIIKKALKVSRRKRRTATMPRIPELDALLDELKGRYRADGVTTLLVNSYGRPWTGDGFGGSFNRIRDAAGIAHVDPETGQRRRKHLHDLRGTFATRLMLAGLTDAEIASVMGWSPEQVGTIRRTYVDDARVVVAIGERIANSAVHRTVNRSTSETEK
jgi:integrase